MPYDKEKDVYICPNEQELSYDETIYRKTKRGYLSKLKIYSCKNCSNCPQKMFCTKTKGNRSIQINERLNDLLKFQFKNAN